MLKCLFLLIKMSTGGGKDYYTMKYRYLEFISENEIKIDFNNFNELEIIYKKSTDFFKDDNYYSFCERLKIFLIYLFLVF